MHHAAFLGLVSLPVFLTLGCSSDPATSVSGAGGSSTHLGGNSSTGSTGSAVASSGSSASTTVARGGSSSSVTNGGSSTSSGGQTTTTSSISSSPGAGGKSANGGSGGGKSANGGSGTGGGSNAAGGQSTSGGGGPTSGNNASGGTVAAAGAKTTGGAAAAGGPNASGGAPVTTTVVGTPQTGDITFYDDVGDGTCSFGVTGETDVAALGQASWNSAAWCGACADVTGPLGTLRVRIVNKCPSCGGAGDLDLNKSAFLKIQEEKVGRFKVTWNYVACDVTGPVQYKFKEGSSPGWTALLVTNTRLPLTKLEWSPDKSTWTAMQRQDYNYFLESAGVGQDPIYVRLTAIDGQQLIDKLPMVEELLVVKGAANFN
jgi:expansin